MAFEVQLFSVDCLNRIIHQSGAELKYSFEIVPKTSEKRCTDWDITEAIY